MSYVAVVVSMSYIVVVVSMSYVVVAVCLCRMMEMSSHTLAVEVVTYQVTREQLNNPVIRL